MHSLLKLEYFTAVKKTAKLKQFTIKYINLHVMHQQSTVHSATSSRQELDRIDVAYTIQQSLCFFQLLQELFVSG